MEIKGVTCPWQEETYDLFDRSDGKSRNELLTLFEDQLSRNPGDISIRFTALNLHYALSHYDSILIEDLVEEARADFAKNLDYLVRLAPVEECTDWPTIRWEISNSYAIRDWDRALRLYNHIETLSILEPAEIQLLRGQFNFLVVFGPRRDSEFDPLEWEPKLYDSADWIKELILFVWSLARKEEITLDDAERDRISDATNDLNKGLKKSANTSLAYRSILAMCHFANEEYPNAAKRYQEILSDRTGFMEAQKFDPLKVLTHISLARSYHLADELEKAKEVLVNCAAEFQNSKGIYEYLSEIQTHQGDKEGASESLRKEVERNPVFGENALVSLPLMWAETRGTPEKIASRLDERHNSNPEIFDPIDSILREYWNPFCLLGDQARTTWIEATYDMYFANRDPQLLRSKLSTVSYLFATAVELELKVRVFESFRVHVSKTDTLSSLARKEKDARHRETEKFCNYLLVRGKKLNLGDMVYILKRCRNASRGTFRELQRWTENRCSIMEQTNLSYLGNICEVRNPATHRDQPFIETIDKEDVERMAGWCRMVLEALTKR